MRTEGALVDPKGELVAWLSGGGERLTEAVSGPILLRGRTVVPALVEILEDEELAQADAPGDGYAPIHAATLLGALQAAEAAGPMLRVLGRCDPMDILYSKLIHTLESLGAAVLEPALAAHAAAGSADQRQAIACVLAGLGVRDDRVLAVLRRALEEQAELGAGLLAEYGDPAALPQLSAALDASAVDEGGGLLANQEIIELDAAIEELGGVLTEEQRSKVGTVVAARDVARAPLLAVGSSGVFGGGAARGRLVESAPRNREENKRRKKLRKARKQAQRRNRR